MLTMSHAFEHNAPNEEIAQRPAGQVISDEEKLRSESFSVTKLLIPFTETYGKNSQLEIGFVKVS